MNANDEFDALLAEALAPPSRAPDLNFMTRVDLAVDEEQRYRRWRRLALDRVASEALMLIGLTGAAARSGARSSPSRWFRPGRSSCWRSPPSCSVAGSR